MRNPEESVAAVGTRLKLSDLQKVYVEFTVNCPADCVGTELIGDLFDGDAGYDAPEQGFSMMLRVGVNRIGQVIDKGENAPGALTYIWTQIISKVLLGEPGSVRKSVGIGLNENLDWMCYSNPYDFN